jgi:hypothetical protein
MRRAIRQGLSLYWREGVLLVATMVMIVLASEIGYRLYHYWTLPDRLYAIVNGQVTADYGPQSTTPYRSDEHAGYVYAPNFSGQRGHPWHSQWGTNSHGHVASVEYPRGKPPGEYRIAVVGDSMTANITNNVRWTEALEEHLNVSPQWRARIGGKVTRVINLGVDGFGMVQFAAMVRHHVVVFNPDQVIVNLISDDILRRLRHLPVPPPTTDREPHIRAYVKTNILDRIDWLTPRSQLVAIAYRLRWWTPAELPWHASELLGSMGPLHKYSSQTEALDASTAAVLDVLSLYPDALFVWMPLWEELTKRTGTPWIGLGEELFQSVPGAAFVPMQPAMELLLVGKHLKDRPDLAGMNERQLFALPEEKKLELHRWFYQPYDSHYTDYGTSLYAREIARYLIGR